MDQNELYPIFLKADQLNLLIVGGGLVATEKLTFLLKSSPNAKVKIVAPEISDEIIALAKKHKQVVLIKKPFEENDLNGIDLVIAGTADKELNKEIHLKAKARKILINVADTPELCDFYMGSIVTKGDLKIAISTNGKSPTFAKRFREIVEDILPGNLPETLDNLENIRKKLKGDFEEKVKKLHEITSVMVKDKEARK